MSTTPEPPSKRKSQRMLSCVLCQKRKVKCERKFPCANCVRNGAQCVQASLTQRSSRRQFPERELLERVRFYEDLLRQNHVDFDPWSAEVPELRALTPASQGRSSDVARPKASTSKEPNKCKQVELWHILSQAILENDSDDPICNNDAVRDAIIKHLWDLSYQSEGSEHLLFGSPSPSPSPENLTFVHPSQIQILKLWQVYLENVNPLLKVTHTVTLQRRIIDAALDLPNVHAHDSILEALMFSIYCVSVLSLSEDECRALFASASRKDVLSRYQAACRQALMKCRVMESSDRDCLTALYLYLISIASETDPRSLSSMLAIAIHIAQRMGIHDETANSNSGFFEAEMRRRLWWSLAIFNNQVCSDIGITPFACSSWDCQIPLNVNDSELRPNSSSPITMQDGPTEAIFTVARSALYDFGRSFYPNRITRYRMKNTLHISLLSEDPDEEHESTRKKLDDLSVLERTMEDKYLSFCDPENPLHFLTIWTTRGYIAKHRLREYYFSIYFSSLNHDDANSGKNEDAEANVGATVAALKMLDSDTKIITTLSAQNNNNYKSQFQWFFHFEFPILAYIHLLRELRKSPLAHAHAWEALNENYKARMTMNVNMNENANTDETLNNAGKQQKAIVIVFSRGVLKAWEAWESATTKTAGAGTVDGAEVMPLPWIVSDVRNRLAQMKAHQPHQYHHQASVDMVNVDGAMLMPEVLEEVLGTDGMAIDMDQFWDTIDWNWVYTQN